MSCELKLVAPPLTLKLTPPSPLTGTGPALSFRTGSALFLTGTDPAYFLGTGPVPLLKTGPTPSLDWYWPRPWWFPAVGADAAQLSGSAHQQPQHATNSTLTGRP